MMQAIIYCLTFPIIPILCRNLWRTGGEVSNENSGTKKMPARELLLSYGIYLLIIQLLTALVMVLLCDLGTSLWEKLDRSPAFVLKLGAVEFAAALVTALADWVVRSGNIRIRVAWQEYEQMGIVRFIGKYISPCAVYLLAAVMLLFNVSLMFDNVLWGDECFSANTARKEMGGILQVLYFWDNHPPLHYYWTKLFGEILGHTGWVYHLAALTPFFFGLVLACFFLKKRFGDIPTAFLIVITGLASTCIRYNLEIRMYSLAFLGVLCCYYCAYRVVSGGKLAWSGMVFWGLFGAYSHYYAMMAAGILIFVTGVATAVRFRGKTWIKSLCALLAYIIGYAPWFKYLFHGTSNVSGNWWMTEVMGLPESMKTILCGAEFEKIVALLLVVTLLALFLAESSIFTVKAVKADGEPVREFTIHRPLLRTWSDEAYAAAIGILSIIGTLIAAYLLCLVVGPVLTGRYLYPVSAMTVLLLVISLSGALRLTDKLGQTFRISWPKKTATTVLVLILLVMIVIGLRNYKVYRAEVVSEKAVTDQTIEIIGDVPEDVAFVSNNVKHLAWTVLYYYYPHRDIETGTCSGIGAEYDRFWYFTPEEIRKSELQEMKDLGYTVESYGSQQIAAYPFELYYFEKKSK